MKTFWDGRGELQTETMVYFTNKRGEFAGRPEARERARLALVRWANVYSKHDRNAAMAATVDNDEWLTVRNGMLLQAVARDVVDHLL